MTDWVIVRVDRVWLKRACAELGGWYPVETRVTKPARKHKPVISQVPIFPSWVFLPYDGGNSLEWVRSVAGVRGILRYGKRVMLLKDDDIAALRVIEEELGRQPRPLEDVVPVIEFKVGDKVTMRGLFEGHSAEVIAVRGTSQVLVLIEKSIKVWVEGCLLVI